MNTSPADDPSPGTLPTPIGNVPPTIHPPSPPRESEESAQPLIKDLAYFAKQIRLRWTKARESILEVGHLILEARKTLTTEEYSKFRKTDLPFDYSVLQKLCALAESKRLNDPKNASLLPHSWNTLYEIMQLPDEAFDAGVNDGTIRQDSQWKEIKELRERFDPPLPKSPASGRSTGPTKKAVPVKLTVRSDSGSSVDDASRAELPPTLFGTPQEISQQPSSAAASTGRITIRVSRQLANKRQVDLKVLKERIEAVLQAFDFIDPTVVVKAV